MSKIDDAFNALVDEICHEHASPETRRATAKDLAGLLSSNTYSWCDGGDTETELPQR